MATANRRKKARPKKEKGLLLKQLKGALRIMGSALLFGVLLFALVKGTEAIGKLSLFELKDIQWTGLKHLKEKDMNKRYQSILGKNLFEVDIRSLHQTLVQNQWIKAATVKKSYPNRLLILVVERRPASVEYDEGKDGHFADFSTPPYLLDNEGVVLAQVSSFDLSLPRFINVAEKRYASALRLAGLIQDETNKQRETSTQDQPLKTTKPKQIFIDLGDPSDLRIYLTEADATTQIGAVRLGKDHYFEKWKQFIHIETDLEERGLTQWTVDLRFSNKGIVTSGTTTASDLLYF